MYIMMLYGEAFYAPVPTPIHSILCKCHGLFKNLPVPTGDRTGDPSIYSLELHHVAIKAGLYRKAVQVYDIPIPCDTSKGYNKEITSSILKKIIVEGYRAVGSLKTKSIAFSLRTFLLFFLLISASGETYNSAIKRPIKIRTHHALRHH